MKIKPEHFTHIKAAIDATITKHGESTIIAAYENGEFARATQARLAA